MSRRPELKRPPQVHYCDDAALKYANNSRMVFIQRAMSDRAIELLGFDENESAYLLDLGCGSGLSGEALSDAGFEWLGIDISHSMLCVAAERNVDGDLFHSDLGNGLDFLREGVFDGAISISTLQWLTHCDTSSTKPRQRLALLFNSLFKCLKRQSRAVFQIYPTDSSQLELISECAMKAGFVFSLVVDYPNSSKAKKFYIILDCGSVKRRLPKAKTMQNNNDDVKYENDETVKMHQSIDSIEAQAMKSHFVHGDNKKKNKKFKKGKRGIDRFQDRDWIIEQKKRRRARTNVNVPNDSKYTGRKRKPLF